MKERIAYEYSTAEQPPNFIQMWINQYDPNWKDKLIDSNGITVDYDESGNPKEYWGWEYTWEKGRQLKKAHYIYGSTMTLEFKYNKSGLRTQKVKKVRDVITETTDYVMSNKTLISMKKGNDTLYFSYDMSGGAPVMVTYNGARYTYVKNLLGDVVALLDASGNIVCEYKYDAWGKPLSVTGTMAQTIGALNPFRYRGYIWDEDMENYYLRSRYYNPSLCRFLQADAHLTINAFAYANNNPVMKVDVEGTEAEANGTTTIVVFLDCRLEKGRFAGKHYDMTIEGVNFSFGEDTNHISYVTVKEDPLYSESPYRFVITDVPYEIARDAIIYWIRMCYAFDGNTYKGTTFSDEDFKNAADAKDYLVKNKVFSVDENGLIHDKKRSLVSYDLETFPCVGAVDGALLSAKFNFANKFHSYFTTPHIMSLYGIKNIKSEYIYAWRLATEVSEPTTSFSFYCTYN